MPLSVQDSGDLYSQKSGIKSRSDLEKQFSHTALQAVRDNYAAMEG